MQKTKTFNKDLTSGNLFIKIILFALPVMLSGISQLLFNTCDLIVVGKFAGEESLSAVGSTSSLINLIINLFMGISIGANVTVARSIGRKDEEKCQKLVHTAILFSVIGGFFLIIFGVSTCEVWLKLMDTQEDVFHKATIYLRIYFCGMIFNMLYNYGASILRSIGETKRPLFYLLIAGVCNVLLNLVFVIFFKLDVAGVALATIISQLISAILVIRLLIKTQGYVNLNLKKLHIDLKSLKDMIIVGLPAGIQGSIFSISNVVIQSSINSFNSVAVIAGNTAASSVEGFVYTSMNSLYQANVSFTSQNYGAKKIKNCFKSLIYSLIIVITVGLTMGFVFLQFSPQLVGLYLKDNATIESLKYGLIRQSIILPSYFLCGIMDVLCGSLRGLGYSILPMLVSIIGVCGFRLVWIYTVFRQSHTLDTLYISYPISWFATALVQLICFIIVFTKLRKTKVASLQIQ